MENSFFAMVFRMKHIRRWGLMHSLIPENLSTHSLEVAVIAGALCEIGNTRFGKKYNKDRITSKALYHDVPEIFTGDIPTPVKYYSDDTKTAYSAVEQASLAKLLDMLPKEMRDSYGEMFEYTPEEKTLIKAADKICAYIKCLEEETYGSNEFTVAGKALYDSVKAQNCAEADYFLQEYISSFTLPIDTLINGK